MPPARLHHPQRAEIELYGYNPRSGEPHAAPQHTAAWLLSEGLLEICWNGWEINYFQFPLVIPSNWYSWWVPSQQGTLWGISAQGVLSEKCCCTVLQPQALPAKHFNGANCSKLAALLLHTQPNSVGSPLAPRQSDCN